MEDVSESEINALSKKSKNISIIPSQEGKNLSKG